MRDSRGREALRSAGRCATGASAATTSFVRLALLAVGNEHVTETPYRLDESGLRGIGLDQPPQPRDLHVDAAVEGAELASARELHQLVARKRNARVLHEHFQQGEF